MHREKSLPINRIEKSINSREGWLNSEVGPNIFRVCERGINETTTVYESIKLVHAISTRVI